MADWITQDRIEARIAAMRAVEGIDSSAGDAWQTFAAPLGDATPRPLPVGRVAPWWHRPQGAGGRFVGRVA